ncbi:Hypothetical protein RY70_1260 [Bifidobacterium bifidum]|nr:Hypothetical protein RY70_1260 [Bifidobacterium bifidum]
MFSFVTLPYRFVARSRRILLRGRASTYISAYQCRTPYRASNRG